MKRLILLIAVVLFYVACKRNNLPEGIIEKEKMLNVMLDMQLSDAAVNQVYPNDSMKMYAHTRYNYVFKKYKIDSAIFTNSLKYYSKNPSELDSMYTLVSDSLTRMEVALKPKTINPDDYLSMDQEHTYNYLFKNFTKDSLKSVNPRYYDSDAKELYNRYKQVLDSVKLQDSLKLKQPQQIQKNNID